MPSHPSLLLLLLFLLLFHHHVVLELSPSPGQETILVLSVDRDAQNRSDKQDVNRTASALKFFRSSVREFCPDALLSELFPLCLLTSSEPILFRLGREMKRCTRIRACSCDSRSVALCGPSRAKDGAAADLERLKPANPVWEASSMRGLMMRSIMSVSTEKVGTTMKSMNPGDKDIIRTQQKSEENTPCQTAAYSHRKKRSALGLHGEQCRFSVPVEAAVIRTL
ncbi:hypothetical protein EYF80_038284 [Liparis tanakae]|uniref:Uncharacterized protein n=1 Tax=Liparis tanakae TaxID=230148 RepID=A0A4Z2GFQ8_9TELE|nr:hypothetical protein EYF80_038284 [Liparis tanakae]